MNFSFLIVIISLGIVKAQSTRFHEFRFWKYINFTWEDPVVYQSAEKSGAYIPQNIIIAGVKYFEDYYYITLPRMKPGVPVTLARIPAQTTKDFSPKLEPFPTWGMNSIDDCNSLQNVQNVEIDTMGQMWIIDGGRINTLKKAIVKCQPKLVIYDIRANRTTTVYNFPEEIAAKNGSFLYDLVLDDTDGGYAYITDNGVSDPGIITYSMKENRAWKIRKARGMFADNASTQFTVKGVFIAAPINIAGIALSPKIHTTNNRTVVSEERTVYFCPLSSTHIYAISTTILKNEEMTTQNTNYAQYIQDLGIKQSQSVGMIMDNQANLYYGLLTENGIGKWNIHTPFASGQKLIAQDDTFLEWPNSFTFDGTGNLTVLMNRLNKFIFDKINIEEPNYRLITAQMGVKSYMYEEIVPYKLNTEPSRSTESEESDLAPADIESSTLSTSTSRLPSSSSSRLIIDSIVLSIIFLVAII